MHSILIIDGEQETREILRESLKKEGYKVYYSDKAKPGLEKARDKNPDLIVSELSFVDAEAFEIIKEVRSDRLLSNRPLIVLTHRSDDFDKVLAFELGADDYIVKPVGVKELAARIKVQFKYR